MAFYGDLTHLKLINHIFLFHSKGFNLYPSFPAAMGGFPQGAVGPATPEHQNLQLDQNASIKTECMTFPPPLQRSPLNTSADRRYGKMGVCLGIHLIFNLNCCLCSVFALLR